MQKIFLMLAILVAGCQISGPEDPRTNELATQRAVWDAYQDGTYDFRINRGCFCANGGEHVVRVVQGKVSSAYSVWRKENVPQDHLQFIETIDELFDMIKRAENEAYLLEVEYSSHGYPARITIDWIKNAVDDELQFEVSELLVGANIPVDTN